MQNISPDILEKIREGMHRSEGTIIFDYYSESLLDPAISGGIIFQIVSGGHLFCLERTDELLLRYYYSSPGTGTRLATIDLKESLQCSKASIGFTWSPTEIRLHFSPLPYNTQFLSAIGLPSDKQFRVGKDGSIHQLGDAGVEVMGVSVYQDGKSVLSPTAIEAWRETKKAVEVLFSGTSSHGFIYEVVITNMSLSLLVTGFEAYTKVRFGELEDEGITPNSLTLIDSFYSKYERESGIAAILETEATQSGRTLLKLLISRGAINFQNYKDCKKAYGKAYGIRFGEIGIPSEDLDKLQKMIRYRHRIIHVSAMSAMLNQPEVPPEEPLFANRVFAESALRVFNMFIDSLHTATLSLRRED